MPKVALYNMEGNQVGEVELSDTVFGVEVNKAVLHEAVTMQLASQRRGTASTKTRGFIRGGGRKPWRQKGTGRARAGSTRSPLWRGGGTTFGPQPRSYGYRLPRKVRRLALKSALSAKVQSGDLVILDQLSMDVPKTKAIAGILDNLNANRQALVVTVNYDENIEKSSRNIPGVTPIDTAGITVYDILRHPKMVITKEAVDRIEEVLGNA